jgi:hypothetical protein
VHHPENVHIPRAMALNDIERTMVMFSPKTRLSLAVVRESSFYVVGQYQTLLAEIVLLTLKVG